MPPSGGMAAKAMHLSVIELSARKSYLVFPATQQTAMQKKPIDLNSPGRFYVDGCKCKGFRACIDAAPDNFAFGLEEGYRAYVRKQPTTPEEERRCQRAVDACPYHAVFNNGGLHWSLEPQRSTGNEWELRVFLPEGICYETDWSPEHNVIVALVHRGSAKLPPLDSILEAGTHRYSNLRQLLRDAPKQRAIDSIKVRITSPDLRIRPLIVRNVDGAPEWLNDLGRNTGGVEGGASCPLLHVSEDLAVAAFFVEPSDKWMLQLVPPEHRESSVLFIDGDLISSALPAAVTFEVLVEAVRVAEMSVLLPVTGLGEGPVHAHVTAFSKRIFASHAEQDRPLVASTDAFLSALGIAELRWGEKIAKAGDDYLEVVQAEITQADSFQLFWSQHAKDSARVRDEWLFALSLRRDAFIRPVYWENEMAEAPQELRHLFFAKIPRHFVIENMEAQDVAGLFGSNARITINKLIHTDKRINITQTGHGNVANVADYMSGVTTAVAQNMNESRGGQEVRDLVKALEDEVAALGTRLDKERSERMGDELTRLREEMAKSKPRREWYEVSLSGLKEAAEAAEAAGAVAKPVLDIVSKLNVLLLRT